MNKFSGYICQCALGRVFVSLAFMGHLHRPFFYELVELYYHAVVTNVSVPGTEREQGKFEFNGDALRRQFAGWNR